MAFTTKAELITEAASWLDSPQWFTNRADALLILAEARLNRALRGRLAKTDDTLTGTASSREVALPADYAEMLGLWLTTSGERVGLSVYTAATLPQTETEGSPRGYAISGSNIILDRPCDQAHTFDILYLAKFALATSDATNWLLTDWPDAYFAALMVEAFAFKRDVAVASEWNGRLQASIEEINQIDSRSDNLAPLRVDPALLRSRRYDLMTDS